MKLFLGKLLLNIKSIWEKFLNLSLIKKVLIVGFLGIVLFFVSQTILGSKSSEPQYQTSVVEKGTLVTSITSSGVITSANNASITTQATGIVKEVYVKNGDFVYAGQNIASITLDQSSLQKQAAAYASYLGAQNSLNSANNQMNALQASLFVANQTFVNGAGITDPIIDDPTYIIQKANWLKAEADYKNQQNVIAQANASLNSASLSLSQVSSILTAPISGTISNLNLTSGLPISSVSTSDNSSLTQSVGNIKLEGGNLQALVSLTEIDVTKVKVGQKVTLVLDAFADKTFTGKVSAINTNGSVSSGVTTYPTTITFDTSIDSIYPNMAVTATIIISVKQDVLLIPTGAVQTQNGASFVRILKNGKITEVEVVIGESSDTQTEIQSGISENDKVVIGATATGTSSTTTTSPFGGSGFGGLRSTGSSGGNQIRIQQR